MKYRKKDFTGQAGQVNRFKFIIFLLTTNLSWWLMKMKNTLNVLTVSKNLNLAFYCGLNYENL